MVQISFEHKPIKNGRYLQSIPVVLNLSENLQQHTFGTLEWEKPATLLSRRSPIWLSTTRNVAQLQRLGTGTCNMLLTLPPLFFRNLGASLIPFPWNKPVTTYRSRGISISGCPDLGITSLSSHNLFHSNCIMHVDFSVKKGKRNSFTSLFFFQNPFLFFQLF